MEIYFKGVNISVVFINKFYNLKIFKIFVLSKVLNVKILFIILLVIIFFVWYN